MVLEDQLAVAAEGEFDIVHPILLLLEILIEYKLDKVVVRLGVLVM